MRELKNSSKSVLSNGLIISENKTRVVIITGFIKSSKNEKTGNMLQTWILERDIDPVTSVKTGSDSKTVCKGCIFASGNGCYVTVFQAPLSIWRAYKNGSYDNYSKLSPIKQRKYLSKIKGRSIRLGAYGNPSLIPKRWITKLVKLSKNHTGYFHNWRELSAKDRSFYGQYLMASCETESSFKLATSYGLRSFIASGTKPQHENILTCLNTTHNMSCSRCGLCNGGNNRNSIWIEVHGNKTKQALHSIQINS